MMNWNVNIGYECVYYELKCVHEMSCTPHIAQVQGWQHSCQPTMT